MRQMLSVREAAGKLGCTLKYVYDLLYAGKLQSEKTGGRWRISASALNERLKAREGKNGQ